MTANALILDGNAFLEQYESKNSQSYIYLNGYVAGMYDAYELIDISIAKCLGENVRMSQIKDSIAIYLKNNPQFRHHAMVVTFPSALKIQFNCKK